MFEFERDFGAANNISADVFLVLEGHGCNLAGLHSKMKEAFKGAINQFTERLAKDGEDLETLADEIVSALKPSKKTPPDHWDAAIKDVEADLTKITNEGMSPKSPAHLDEIHAQLTAQKSKLNNLLIGRMADLVERISPLLGWDSHTSDSYMEKYADMTESLQKQTYTEAKAFLETIKTQLSALLNPATTETSVPK
jgi:hypothetical protein